MSRRKAPGTGARSGSLLRGYAPVLLLFVVALGGAIAWARNQGHGPSVQQVERSASGCVAARDDFRRHASGVWLRVGGRVDRLLGDARGRFVHQRFIVRCRSGQTLLVVNDVSIGQRVPVTVGSDVLVEGQYIWNAEGGLIHFTHHNPEGGQGGWIEYRGKVYADGGWRLS